MAILVLSLLWFTAVVAVLSCASSARGAVAAWRRLTREAVVRPCLATFVTRNTSSVRYLVITPSPQGSGGTSARDAPITGGWSQLLAA